MRSHDVDYRILGSDIQVLEIELDPQETVIAEAGAMVYMDEAIAFETKMGDGSTPDQSILGKLFSAGTRLLVGESLFLTHFTHRGSTGKSRVAFSAPYPGTIIPIDLGTMPQGLIVQKDGFLAAARGTQISLHFNQKFGSGLFGGEGFILPKAHRRRQGVRARRRHHHRKAPKQRAAARGYGLRSSLRAGN